MKPLDFIASARILVQAEPKRPTQATLRRAVSTAYYAMFHCLARTCADLLVGGESADRSKHAWRQVYRAVEHNATKSACKDRTVIVHFPKEIEDFSNSFISMQEKRHKADYDPTLSLTKSEVAHDISFAEQAIKDFYSAPTKDRKAFCAFILFKKRI